MSKKKIVIAVGGSGGHLFPAQSLAEDLMKQSGAFDLVFAGAGLSTNRYFHKLKYTYREVKSATPFKRSVKAISQSLWTLSLGIWQSLRILNEIKPDLVIGFGSFHSFPLLVAACIKRIPLVLFESNAIPGKVNRLCSYFSKLTAIHFSDAKAFLKGTVVEVKMPIKERRELSFDAARVHFNLAPNIPTLLVFGGSQGSSAINEMFLKVAEEMQAKNIPFQVIHLTGKVASAQEIALKYQELNIPSYVRDFESEMDTCYAAATLAISRSGAVTLSELIAFELPSILIPYPHAADNHQTKNAQFLRDQIRGGVYFEEKELHAELLKSEVISLLDSVSLKHHKMKNALREFKSKDQ